MYLVETTVLGGKPQGSECTAVRMYNYHRDIQKYLKTHTKTKHWTIRSRLPENPFTVAPYRLDQ